jgi:hypothetical protein
MKRPRSLLFPLACLLALCPLAAPLLAQPEIGGNTCASSTISGAYAFTLTGRQVTAAGNLSSVLQANGAATFDGLNKVTITMTADTLQSVATPMTWSGTYTMQSNCVGTVTITSASSPVLNLVSYDQGVDFLVTGNDAIYNYTGRGSTQPSSCSAATLSGVYTLTGTGYSVSGTAVNASEDGTGLLQFDGVGSVTANFNTFLVGKAPTALTLTGSYSISSNCLGSANLTDSTKTNNYVMSISISNSSAANGAYYAALAQNGKLLINGSGNAAYGQPTTAAALGATDPFIESPAESATGRGL